MRARLEKGHAIDTRDVADAMLPELLKGCRFLRSERRRGGSS
jgi:hypothetical protein